MTTQDPAAQYRAERDAEFVAEADALDSATEGVVEAFDAYWASAEGAVDAAETILVAEAARAAGADPQQAIWDNFGAV